MNSASARTRAVISLGTNTTRLLVVRDGPDGGIVQLEHRQTGTRLGEGLRDGGNLAPAAMQRTLEAVADFVAVARGYGAELAGIATSAVRRADNAGAFAERMRALSGVELEVLPGTLEAQASYRGATYGVAHTGRRVAVLDIGGGSTECAVGSDGTLSDALSLEIGSVRIGERFPALLGATPGAPARAAAREARLVIAAVLEPLFELPRVAEVRCVAGTPLTLGAVIAGARGGNPSGTTLTLDALDELIRRLLDMTLGERRALSGMPAQRADIIAAGALVLSQALRALGVSAGRLEENDLLLGYLLLRREREAAATK